MASMTPVNTAERFLMDAQVNSKLASITSFEAIANNTNSHLLETHILAWQKLWKNRIELEGNLELAQIVNSSMYYLLSSIREYDSLVTYEPSITPVGLGSNQYGGHIFVSK